MDYVWSRGSNHQYTVHVAWEHDSWVVEVRHPPTPRRSSKNVILERSGWCSVRSETMSELLSDLGFCPYSWDEYHRLAAHDHAEATMLEPDELVRRWHCDEVLGPELPPPEVDAANGDPTRDDTPSNDFDDDPFAYMNPELPTANTGREIAAPAPSRGRSDRYVESLIDANREAIHAATEGRTLRTCAVLTVDHDGTCAVARRELEPAPSSAVYARAATLAAIFRLPVVIFDRPADETFVTAVLAPPPTL